MSELPRATPARWNGRLHDGETAVGHTVAVTLGDDALDIARPDGTTVARWPYATLVAVEPVRPDQPAVLARGPDDDARLTLTHPTAFG
ncbi:MAG: hypothetical protein JO021_17420, partial [Alphaproteobacteria bacterium]|nr:hypothetical protein [Alphaproteobacteria bacterium]